MTLPFAANKVAPSPTKINKPDNTKNRAWNGEAFEFGYVQTVHLAQGSQWKNGIYFEEFLPSNNNQLHYTALSRFSNKCIYVKRNRR